MKQLSFSPTLRRTLVVSPVMLLGALTVALCAPKKDIPLRNSKQIGEMCARRKEAKTLSDCKVCAESGCSVINGKNRAGVAKCVTQAMARIKQLKPNMK